MPLRCVPAIAAPSVRRCGVHRALHTTRVCRGDGHDAEVKVQNHYEALNLHPEATPAEIKKFVGPNSSLSSPRPSPTPILFPLGKLQSAHVPPPSTQIFLRPLQIPPPGPQPDRPPCVAPFHAPV